ncbi:hypothetical protein T190820D02B_20041 [Tenacibaculum sp. 190524A05c]
MIKSDNFLDYWLNGGFVILSRYLLTASIAFLLFYILFKKQFWFRKIQKKLPKLKDYQRDIGYSLISISIFATVSLIIFFYLISYTNIYFDFNKYSIGYYVFS